MSEQNFEELFTPAPSDAKPFDKEAWAAKKQTERQAVYDLADQTALAVVGDSQQLRSYLDVQSRFPRHSATNALLIYAQMPQATQLKDYDGWKESGVSIKREQHGISILEPGKGYTRADGSTGTSYQVKKVFDIAQTTALQLKTEPSYPEQRNLAKALLVHTPVPVQMVDKLPHDAGAYYASEKKTIFVCRGMAPQDAFRSLTHELALAEFAMQRPDYHRPALRFSAQCATYLLCRRYGVDVAGVELLSLPEHTHHGDPMTVRTALSLGRDAAAAIATRVDRALEQQRTTKGKDNAR